VSNVALQLAAPSRILVQRQPTPVSGATGLLPACSERRS
jgi:hypothetical protein